MVCEQLIETFIDRYYPAAENISLAPTSDFASRADQYAGTYYLARSNFSTHEKSFLTMSTINVRVNGERVYFKVGNETVPYIETEPGFLINPNDPADTFVLKKIGDQVTLSPPKPFVLIKMPWYMMLPLHMFILIGGALLFLIAIITWVVSFFKSLKTAEKRPVLAGVSRLSAGLFGLIFLYFMINFGIIFADIHPAFGVPRIIFGFPANSEMLFLMPTLMAIFSLLMLVFSVIAWIKRLWTLKARLFFSILTIFALAILWSLYFWNLLF
jgi:hypothetical protein